MGLELRATDRKSDGIERLKASEFFKESTRLKTLLQR